MSCEARVGEHVGEHHYVCWANFISSCRAKIHAGHNGRSRPARSRLQQWQLFSNVCNCGRTCSASYV